jgi:hypothetical protein
MVLSNAERQARFRQRLKEGSASMAALYQLSRFGVLSAALTPGPAERLDDALVFAWDEGVFPLFHESPLAAAVESEFDIGRENLRGFMKAIDERWQERERPNFYTVEQDYNWREGDFWTRRRMIAAFRYARLSRRFDNGLYEGLVAPGEHPIEATEIMDPFDRSTISLG